MYICKYCAKTFEQPKMIIDTHGLDSPPYETYPVCPYCGGSSIIETIQCTKCNDYIYDNYIETEDGDIICDECYTIKSLRR